MQAEEQKRIKIASRQARVAQEAIIPNEEKPDKLVDLSLQLALLLVQNHRNSLNSYKASKSVGIDNIINIVATGCHEAESIDTEFLQG